MLNFRFHLMPVSDIMPWGQPERPSLSWFGLTLGWFWIEADGQELFRYTREALNHWRPDEPSGVDLPYEDYPVARYWEDLLEMLPSILDPVPDELAQRLQNPSSWHAWLKDAEPWLEESDDWDTYYQAVSWWGRRTWNAGHLSYPPCLWLWSVGDDVHLRWNNQGIVIGDLPVWTAQAGEMTVPRAEFINAVESFHNRLFVAMAERIDAIRLSGLLPDYEIDLTTLDNEQKDRFDWLAPALRSFAQETRRTFTWNEVILAMKTINFNQSETIFDKN